MRLKDLGSSLQPNWRLDSYLRGFRYCHLTFFLALITFLLRTSICLQLKLRTVCCGSKNIKHQCFLKINRLLLWPYLEGIGRRRCQGGFRLCLLLRGSPRQLQLLLPQQCPTSWQQQRQMKCLQKKCVAYINAIPFKRGGKKDALQLVHFINGFSGSALLRVCMPLPPVCAS